MRCRTRRIASSAAATDTVDTQTLYAVVRTVALIGAKLANIFSTEFVVETNDLVNGKYYRQVFSGNMKNKTKPEIKDAKGASGW